MLVPFIFDEELNLIGRVSNSDVFAYLVLRWWLPCSVFDRVDYQLGINWQLVLLVDLWIFLVIRFNLKNSFRNLLFNHFPYQFLPLRRLPRKTQLHKFHLLPSIILLPLRKLIEILYLEGDSPVAFNLLPLSTLVVLLVVEAE